MVSVVVDRVVAELERVHKRVAGRFVRSESRVRAREYVSGLFAGLGRRTDGPFTSSRPGDLPAGNDLFDVNGAESRSPGVLLCRSVRFRTPACRFARCAVEAVAGEPT